MALSIGSLNLRVRPLQLRNCFSYLMTDQYDEEQGKRRKKERGREEGFFSLSDLSPNPFSFSCLLFFAPPALSERLEKSILGLKDSSVAAGNNATTVLFSKEALGSLSATRLLII